MPGLNAARRNILEESGKDALRWHGEPVFVYSGSVSELLPFVPRFERRPFGAADGEEIVGLLDPGKFYPSGENKLWDVVVRVPLNEEERETPVGIVSKRYKLVQHEDLFCRANDAIQKVGINEGQCAAELLLSAYGTRMEVTVTFPEGLGFDPGDGSELRLRLYCVNSVDASSRLAIMLGWFRFVCGNGLIVGTARLSQRFVHHEYLELPDLVEVLSRGLSLAEKEKATLQGWINKPIPRDRLETWVDGTLRDSWGPLAAVSQHRHALSAVFQRNAGVSGILRNRLHGSGW